MSFTISSGDEPGSLRLNGELDVAEADALIERAAEALPEHGDLVFDVGELTFIDSSGVRALVTVAGMMPQGGRLVLRAPTSAVRRVLDLVGLSDTTAAIHLQEDATSD